MRKKFVAVACAATLALSMPTLAFAAGEAGDNGSNKGTQSVEQTNTPDKPSADKPGTAHPDAPDEYLAPEPNTVFIQDATYYPELNKVVGQAAGTDANGEYYFAKVALKDTKDVEIKLTDKKASNFDDSKKYTKVQSFEITSKDYKAGSVVTVAWQTYENATGYACYVYVEHGDGSDPEWFYLPVDENGEVTLTMDNLSTVTFALTGEKYVEPAPAADVPPATDAPAADATTNVAKAAKTAVIAVDNGATSPQTGDAL
ncbi:hypothetical protein [Adlercreutzia sp. ZJ473]|uniref:hypothetical protein n=1 Tax=Adlercreutzia sp. ZJ473 TaxID=2722822 RepID=UPI001557074D|nr:hypothetical protein [Adlercreutzia sp. ZJ473]